MPFTLKRGKQPKTQDGKISFSSFIKRETSFIVELCVCVLSYVIEIVNKRKKKGTTTRKK